MYRTRFGPAKPAIEQQQTYALDREATAMQLIYFFKWLNSQLGANGYSLFQSPILHFSLRTLVVDQVLRHNIRFPYSNQTECIPTASQVR
jgi:hypothetical protein